jgi:hypothetical protein
MKNETQGKKPTQNAASELIAGIGFIGFVLTFIYLLIFKK